MKILVVDDEEDICEILQFNLETEGYEVITANSAEEAQKLNLANFNLILLDIMMGEISGFQFAKQIKNDFSKSEIPIIFITALDDEDNIVTGLNIGADDYITKPLSIKEVKARVNAVLRRYSPNVNIQKTHIEPTQNDKIIYENLVLNLNSKTAYLNEINLSLTKLEFELLSLFLQNPNKVFNRNDLLKLCWPPNVLVLDRTVDVNITRLRKKIQDYGKQIKTRIGYGYCFEK